MSLKYVAPIYQIPQGPIDNRNSPTQTPIFKPRICFAPNFAEPYWTQLSSTKILSTKTLLSSSIKSTYSPHRSSNHQLKFPASEQWPPTLCLMPGLGSPACPHSPSGAPTPCPFAFAPHHQHQHQHHHSHR